MQLCRRRICDCGLQFSQAIRKMLSFPGRSRGTNRRNLRHLESRRRTEQTVLQVDEVVFPDGSSVAGAGGTLESDVTNNVQSNTFQYAVTERGVIDALESITAEHVSVNLSDSQNVNTPRDGDPLNFDADTQLPDSSGAWHNVTPVSNTLPDQGTGSFAYAKSATPLFNASVYDVGGDATSSAYTQYVEILEPGVYELEADMYWVSSVSQSIEKTIATQIYIKRYGTSDYSGIGPVSTCFMFGNVRMGSTSVSTVTQCAAGDMVRVMAVGTTASTDAGTPSVTSPAGRSSLFIRRISNHFNGHLSFLSTVNDSVKVYKGLPEGIPDSDYEPSNVVIDISPLTTDPTIDLISASTWVSGARDFYIKVTPPSNRTILTTVILRNRNVVSSNSPHLIEEALDAADGSLVTTKHSDADKYLKLLSGTFNNGLIRFMCGTGLNLNDLKAGVATSNSAVDTRPLHWLEFSFS